MKGTKKVIPYNEHKQKGKIMEVKVLLKSLEEIEALLEESEEEGEEGQLHTEGIGWKSDRVEMEHVLKAIEQEYEGSYDIETQDGIWLTSLWVKSFVVNGKEVSVDNIMSTKYLKLDDKSFLSFENLEVVDSLPLCKHCGAVLTDGEDDLCNSCVEKLTRKDSYRHKPEFKFKGKQIKADAENPIWYGIELEYSLKSNVKMAELKHKYMDDVYLVSDGSIYDSSEVNYKAELVSMPHSFNKLMSKNSYLDELPNLDVVNGGTKNGCHVHISRTAFKDSKHFGLFYFLILEDQKFAQYIGNRKETNYCQFTKTGSVATKDNAAKPNYNRTAINERNDDTIEIRFFNSSNDLKEVKTYIQYLDSLIKYTKYAKVSVSLKGWKSYVKKYIKKYKELYNKIEKYENDLSLVVKYREPKIYKTSVKKLKLSDLYESTSLTVTYKHDSNTKSCKVNPETDFIVVPNENSIKFYCEDHGWHQIKAEDVVSIEYTK